MKKCYLDSNILVYIKDSDSLKHEEAAQKLSSLVAKDYQIFISSLVLDEFVYVFRYGLLRKKSPNLYMELKKAVEEVLEIPELSIVNPPIDSKSQLQVIDFMSAYGLSPRDGYHLLTMMFHSIHQFLTFDNDFKKVFSAKILKKA